MHIDHNRDLFIQAPDKYTRNLDIVKEAIETYAHFFHLKSKRPLEECRAFLKANIGKDKKYPLTPINLMGLRQNEVEDRVKAKIPFDKFLNMIKRNKFIVSPNVCVYYHPDDKESILARYIKKKRVLRGIVKKKGQIAEQLGNMEEFSACNYLEYNIKILSNSLSGAQSSKFNILWNESAHSTLSSIGRTFTSYSNASTERFLAGNRHYWSRDIVIENILTVTRNTDYKLLSNVIQKYQIRIPSVNEIMYQIGESTRYYWRNEKHTKEIKDLVETLSDIQKVAYLYTGDFYSLYTLNDSLIKFFLEDLITVKDWLPLYPDVDIDLIVNKVNSGIGALSCVYCKSFLQGTTIGKLRETDYENYKVYTNTILHIELTLVKYSDLLTVFFRTNNLPSSIFVFPSSIRKVVVGSDTDSVMYTVQNQVIWKYGRVELTSKGSTFANTIAFLNNTVVDHALVVVSKQMGVSDEELYTLRMKNEFEFLVYMKANRAKHYATLLTIKEGMVFKNPRSEIKGVGLKDSKIPKFIMKSLDEELVRIMTELAETGEVYAFTVLQKIANFEHQVLESLNKGEITYLIGVNINAKDGYKNPERSNYVHYELWEKVFAKKFGFTPSPPYRAIKISTLVDKPAIFKQWLNRIEPSLKEPLEEWMKDCNRKYLKQLLLPSEIVSKQIPQDFLDILNVRATIANMSASYYILLEMLGFYFDNSKKSQLVSDNLPYRPEYGLPGNSIVIGDMTIEEDEEEIEEEIEED